MVFSKMGLLFDIFDVLFTLCCVFGYFFYNVGFTFLVSLYLLFLLQCGSFVFSESLFIISI